MSEQLHLLYAADHARDADLTRLLFDQDAADLRLDIVETGAGCLARLADESLDLLLLDHHLPDMEGLGVLARLRADGHFIKAWPAPPRVVIVTIHDSSAYRRSVADAHADGFIGKSRFTEEVLAVVDSCFNAGASASAKTT